jgi:predicted nucleic acid-binding protein
MEIKTIVDAGPLIGWLNAADQWHKWSVSVLSARRGALHTTEIVLGEACWQLGGNTQPVHGLLDLVRKRALVLARPWPDHLAGTQQIMLKYPSMDAADASLVWLAEISPKAVLVTTDRRDFEPCRGLRNRALKLILPE